MAMKMTLGEIRKLIREAYVAGPNTLHELKPGDRVTDVNGTSIVIAKLHKPERYFLTPAGIRREDPQADIDEDAPVVWVAYARTDAGPGAKVSGYATLYYFEDPSYLSPGLLDRGPGYVGAGQVVLNGATVEAPEAQPLADLNLVRQFNKSDLICYVIAVNGRPTYKEDALQAVAKLQNAGYVAGSNFGYFDNREGLPAKGFLVAQKLGRKTAYDVTEQGRARAARAIEALGTEPAQVALGAPPRTRALPPPR